MIIDCLKGSYHRARRSYVESSWGAVPERYHWGFVHWGGGVEAQYIYSRFLSNTPAGSRVLIVGLMGGREYYLCKRLCYSTVAVDLGPQPEITDILIHNIEEPLPFADDTFDAAIMGEVLEHLAFDVQALCNVRRVLKDDGMLMASLPYYNDWEEGHMRIHSPESARRLFTMAGFAVADYVERPGIFPLNSLNAVQHAVNVAIHKLTRHTVYGAFGQIVGRFEYAIGKVTMLRSLRRLSSSFGGYYCCQKSDSLNHVVLNRALYTVRNAQYGTAQSSFGCRPNR
jgi:SAM-dependent methyltransferase